MNMVGYIAAPIFYYVTNKAVTSAWSSRSERENLDVSILSWTNTAEKLTKYNNFNDDHPASDAIKMVKETVDKIEYILKSAQRQKRERYALTKTIWPYDWRDVNKKLHELRNELDLRVKLLLKLTKIPINKK